MDKRTALAPLETIRLMLKNCTTSLLPLTHQINALPLQKELEYYFVPAEHTDLFRPYADQIYKNLKLVNYKQPAISVFFFPKHKYKISRQIQPAYALEIMQAYRDELNNRSFFGQLSTDQQRELQRIEAMTKSLQQTPEQFQFCISNYHHYYQYWYCSYRYFIDEEQTKTNSINQHLLKHTQRIEGRTHQRLNIIFVDMDYIIRPVSYDNKLIDRELATYTDRINFGKAALYIKSVS